MKAFYAFSGPSEFWSITPVEANILIEARSRNRIVMAWEQAGMSRLAKTRHFPRSPKDLFKDKPATMTDSAIVAFGKMMEAMDAKKKNNAR